MTSNCNKYLEPTGVVLGKSTRTLGKVTLTTDGVYDSTKEYSRISLVYDPNTYISYISKQFVPAGTALSNTEYWQPLNSAILGPGQTLSGVLNMLNMLDLPEDAGFLHYNDLTNQLEWVDVEGLVEIINNSGVDFILNEPLKSINSLSTSATTAGQMLIFNGTRWRLDKITNISQAIGEPLKSIAMLGAPSGSKKIIMYNNGSWGYTDLSNMNLGSLLTDINDKNAPVPSSAGYLYYNGSNYSWNIPSSGSGSQGVTLNALLTKLNATALPTLGQKYLYWNGLSFSWNDGTGVLDWNLILNKPTTLAGYGITTSDPLISDILNTFSNPLKEPLLSINSINRNPSTAGMILVYRENGWQFEAKPTSSSSSGTSSYDDSWIYTWKDQIENRTIRDINNTLASLQESLNSKVEWTKAEIESWINQALADYEWWTDNTIIGEIFHQSSWNDELEAYLQTVGVLDSNGNLNYSTITQRIDQIEAQVALLQPSDDGDFETLQSLLNQYITRVNGVETAVATLGTRYAVLEENQSVIRWLASGFTSETSQYGTFASMFAAKQDENIAAISDLETRVTDVENEYGTLTSAHASVAAQINGDSSTGTGGLIAEVTALNGKLQGVNTTVLASIDSKLSAFTATADFDQAVATMLANSDSGTYAAIQTIASDDDSFIGLIADRIGIDASTTTFTGNIVAQNLYLPSSGEIDVNHSGLILKAAQGTNGNVAGLYINESGDDQVGNIAFNLDNTIGFNLTCSENSSDGVSGDLTTGSIIAGKMSTGDFVFSVSITPPESGNNTNEVIRRIDIGRDANGNYGLISTAGTSIGVGYTGSLNGLKFINGICVGTP